MLEQLLVYIRTLNENGNSQWKTHLPVDYEQRISKGTQQSQIWTLFWKQINNLSFPKENSLNAMTLQSLLKNISSPIQSEQNQETLNKVVQQSQFYEAPSKQSQADQMSQKHSLSGKSIDKQLRKLEAKRKKLAATTKKQVKKVWKQSIEEKREKDINSSLIIRQYMRKIIRQKQEAIFKLSVVKIEQQAYGFVNVYLENSLKKIPILTNSSNIIQILGQSRFKEIKDQKKTNQNEKWCHCCRKNKNQKGVLTCTYREKQKGKQQLGLHSNPLKLLFTFFKSDQKDSSKYHYPYLQYIVEKGHRVCERAYCLECLSSLRPGIPSKAQFICPFCKGDCQCERCLTCDEVVKYQAEYLNNGGSLDDLVSESIVYQAMNRQLQVDPEQEKSSGKSTPSKKKKIEKKKVNAVQESSTRKSLNATERDHSETSVDLLRFSYQSALAAVTDKNRNALYQQPQEFWP